jgi:hypothetical protein
MIEIITPERFVKIGRRQRRLLRAKRKEQCVDTVLEALVAMSTGLPH